MMESGLSNFWNWLSESFKQRRASPLWTQAFRKPWTPCLSPDRDVDGRQRYGRLPDSDVHTF